MDIGLLVIIGFGVIASVMAISGDALKRKNATIADQQERIRGYQQTLAAIECESKAEWGQRYIVDAPKSWEQRTQPMKAFRKAA